MSEIKNYFSTVHINRACSAEPSNSSFAQRVERNDNGQKNDSEQNLGFEGHSVNHDAS